MFADERLKSRPHSASDLLELFVSTGRQVIGNGLALYRSVIRVPVRSIHRACRISFELFGRGVQFRCMGNSVPHGSTFRKVTFE
jgi:hypothetical protein